MKKSRSDLRDIFLSHIGKKLDLLIGKINPVIRGKANYINKVVSSKALQSLDDYMFIREVRYVKRHHPKKPKYWTKHKYWGRLNFQRPNDKWVFGNKTNGNYITKFSWVKISRHTLIKGKSSPDDPSLIDYWNKRNKKINTDKSKSLSKKHEYIAYKQDYKCPICGQSIFNDEPLHLHHITPRSKGGKDKTNNLVWLHLQCHHKTHHQKE